MCRCQCNPVHQRVSVGDSMDVRSSREVSRCNRKALKSVYSEMADLARERHGDVPLIAMGHLTAMDEQYNLSEMPRSIHRIIDKGLDGEIFGGSVCIHRFGAYPSKVQVRGEANAWYCGSPMPCSIAEAEDGSERGVWVVPMSGDPDERPLPVAMLAPIWRQMIRWQGPESEDGRVHFEFDLE